MIFILKFPFIYRINPLKQTLIFFPLCVNFNPITVK